MSKSLSPGLAIYLKSRTDIIKADDYDALFTARLVEEGWIEELLDFLYESGVRVSTDAVAKALTDHYRKGSTYQAKEEIERRIEYHLNRYQIAFYKTIASYKPEL